MVAVARFQRGRNAPGDVALTVRDGCWSGPPSRRLDQPMMPMTARPGTQKEQEHGRSIVTSRTGPVAVPAPGTHHVDLL